MSLRWVKCQATILIHTVKDLKLVLFYSLLKYYLLSNSPMEVEPSDFSGSLCWLFICAVYLMFQKIELFFFSRN